MFLHSWSATYRSLKIPKAGEIIGNRQRKRFSQVSTRSTNGKTHDFHSSIEGDVMRKRQRDLVENEEINARYNRLTVNVSSFVVNLNVRSKREGRKIDDRDKNKLKKKKKIMAMRGSSAGNMTEQHWREWATKIPLASHLFARSRSTVLKKVQSRAGLAVSILVAVESSR